jgi:iron complex transport system permease protein
MDSPIRPIRRLARIGPQNSMQAKRALIFWLLVTATPLLLGLCLLLGASGIGLPDLNTAAGKAIFGLRLTRVAAGFVIGASLACAGVVLQALLRNPLAEPYVLGISSGAGLGAAFAILTGLAGSALFGLPILAFVFACATLLLVYALASEGGSPSIYGLILSGVIVSSVCSSLLMFLISVAPIEGLHSVMWWMLGNLQVPSLILLTVCSTLAAAGWIAVWLLAAELNALTLGAEMAHHLGVRTRIVILVGLGLATLITAASVAMAGLIGFVGLIVPHAARALIGPDHRRLIPAAALGGGVFLAVCDAVARVVLAPREIPVGVITALIGGPFFLVILHQRRKQGWIG